MQRAGFQTFCGGGAPDSDDDVIYNVRRVPADRLNFAFCLNYSGFSSGGRGWRWTHWWKIYRHFTGAAGFAAFSVCTKTSAAGEIGNACLFDFGFLPCAIECWCKMASEEWRPPLLLSPRFAFETQHWRRRRGRKKRKKKRNTTAQAPANKSGFSGARCFIWAS